MPGLHHIEDMSLTARGMLLHNIFLSRSQYWEVDRQEAYQLELCRKLLISAYENTQYYHRLFHLADFDPYTNLKSLDDLKKIPILNKETVLQNKSDMVNGHELRKSLELRTSGTTGQPFKVYVSKKHWIVEQGVTWRHWSWMGYRFRDRMAIIRSYVPKPGEPLWKLDNIRNFLYFSAYHLRPENIPSYVARLTQWRPQFLRGYPSSLYIFARMAKDLRLSVPRVKGILTASETLLPHYRETIEEVFGGKVFDWYGQAETLTTMNECGVHNGLHINIEYGLCELNGDPLLRENERRIVATCLQNYAMPLIRYDTGDIAVIDDEGPCACGRTLPKVKAIRGRSDDLLFTPDGRVIPSVNLYTLMYHYVDKIIAFQFIQESVDRLELRLKTNQFHERDLDRLRADLVDRFGTSVKIDIIQEVDFVQVGEGKTPVIVSKVKNALF